jgi:hypothetical protein
MTLCTMPSDRAFMMSLNSCRAHLYGTTHLNLMGILVHIPTQALLSFTDPGEY